MNVDVSHNSWRVRLIGGKSGEGKPIGVVENANKKLSLMTIEARNGVNDQLQRFLKEYNIV